MTALSSLLPPISDNIQQFHTLMTRQEVAAILGVTPQTISAWAGKNGFPEIVRVGPKDRPRLRFRRAEIEEYMRLHGLTVAEAEHAV
ncbi:MAG TPA: helix-turn-helix domain-containing protein [Gemmataceae bacterium]|nr:helix-turn-helix domain-containing protein [Gemmataceae bacterium]